MAAAFLIALACGAVARGGFGETPAVVRVSRASSVRNIRARNPLDGESDFERYEVLGNILDSGTSEEEVNRLVSLLLGYGRHRPYVEAERARAWQTEFPSPPDLFAIESDAFAWLESDIPDDPDQIESMQVLFRTLHGEEAVAMAQRSGDPEFARRSTIVTWMVLTTSYWSEIVSRR
jgi:hypothetical protein